MLDTYPTFNQNHLFLFLEYFLSVFEKQEALDQISFEEKSIVHCRKKVSSPEFSFSLSSLGTKTTLSRTYQSELKTFTDVSLVAKANTASQFSSDNSKKETNKKGQFTTTSLFVHVCELSRCSTKNRVSAAVWPYLPTVLKE